MKDSDSKDSGSKGSGSKGSDSITKPETVSARDRKHDTVVDDVFVKPTVVDETFAKPTVVDEAQRGRLVNGTILDNRYCVVKFLREGGLSTIYGGVDKKMPRRVALKVMQPLDDRSEAARAQIRALLEEESRIIARIKKDEHIVECFDCGVTDDGRPYLVLELLEGVNLEHYLRKHIRMSLGKSLQTILPAAWALSAAHEASVLHRDVKPGNLFLANTRGGVVVKLIDFNVSKRTLTGTAQTGLGTDYYMAPELAEMRPASELSDLWALAAVLVECLTGKRHKDIRAAAPSAPLVDVLREALPALPEGLLEVIVKALAPEPENRWPSVHAFGLALLPFAEANTKMRWTEKFTAAPTELSSGFTAALNWVENEQRLQPPTFTPKEEAPSTRPTRFRVRSPRVIAAAGLSLFGIIGLGAFLLRSPAAPDAPDTIPAALLSPPAARPAAAVAPPPSPPALAVLPEPAPAAATAPAVQLSAPVVTPSQRKPKRRHRSSPAATVDENGIPLLAP